MAQSRKSNLQGVGICCLYVAQQRRRWPGRDRQSSSETRSHLIGVRHCYGVLWTGACMQCLASADFKKMFLPPRSATAILPGTAMHHWRLTCEHVGEGEGGARQVLRVLQVPLPQLQLLPQRLQLCRKLRIVWRTAC